MDVAGGAPPMPAPMNIGNATPLAPASPDDAEGGKGAPSQQDSAELLDGDSSSGDFQQVEPGARSYSHKLRRGWSKFDARIDFTETLLFTSAQPFRLHSNGMRTQYSRFSLNDQVSSFVITVNVFSEDGRYAFTKKTLVSSKNTYSAFTLPPTLVKGDDIEIPITIFNNRKTFQRVEVEIIEEGRMLSYVNKREEEMIISESSRSQFVYRIKADEVGPRSLQIALSVDGEDQDMIRRETTIIEDGFDQ